MGIEDNRNTQRRGATHTRVSEFSVIGGFQVSVTRSTCVPSLYAYKVAEGFRLQASSGFRDGLVEVFLPEQC